ILPRIRYLLESDPSAALEECLISILVAIARHSPTCAEAIIKCERLLQVIIHSETKQFSHYIVTVEKLIEKNILHEFTAITKEAYLVLKALTKTLPNFYSQKIDQNDTETWRWSHVGPMIDLALKWVSLKSDESLSSLLLVSNGTKKEGLTSILWVISAVMHFLVGVLKSVIPDDNSSIQGGNLPWLPEFVPKIGLHIIKNGLLSFTQGNEHSFLEFLCQYRPQSDQETSLASVCCLDGLVEVAHSVNSLIQLANTKITVSSIEHSGVPSADKILTDGILKCSLLEMTTLLTTLMKLTSSSGKLVQSIEMFGRDRKRCMEFVDSGRFQKLLSHLYRCAFSLDNFLNIEKEKFKLLSALLVEQLRLWKVGIQYGYCVSYFSELFPALYNWLDVPAVEKLIEKNILHEFTAITKEAYLPTPKQCFTSRCPVNYGALMHLGENLLALGLSGISPNHISSADSSTSVGSDLHLVSTKRHPDHG
nr:transcriptional elongation regulator MINIYO [Tanacetum cinerariifolium]